MYYVAQACEMWTVPYCIDAHVGCVPQQFIIGKKGAVGLTYEHTPAEGPPIANLMDYIMDYMWVSQGFTPGVLLHFIALQPYRFTLSCIWSNSTIDVFLLMIIDHSRISFSSCLYFTKVINYCMTHSYHHRAACFYCLFIWHIILVLK